MLPPSFLNSASSYKVYTKCGMISVSIINSFRKIIVQTGNPTKYQQHIFTTDLVKIIVSNAGKSRHIRPKASICSWITGTTDGSQRAPPEVVPCKDNTRLIFRNALNIVGPPKGGRNMIVNVKLLGGRGQSNSPLILTFERVLWQSRPPQRRCSSEGYDHTQSNLS